MKIKLLFIALATVSIVSAQEKTGINTANPKATLEIAKETTNSTNDLEGILIPRVSKNKAFLMGGNALIEESTLIYVTDVSDYTTTPVDSKVADVTENGYYLWNGTKWVQVSSKNGKEWKDGRNTEGTNLIYANQAKIAGNDLVVTDDGKIGIGTVSPKAFLDVQGNVRLAKNRASFTDINSYPTQNSDNTLMFGLPGSHDNFEIFRTAYPQNTLGDGNGTLFFNGIDRGNTPSNVSFVFGATAPSKTFTPILYMNGQNHKVGIGTIAPSAKLHVDGNARISSLPTGGTGDYVVTADANGNLRRVSRSSINSSSNNIYNTNGTLTASRSMNMNGKTLSFTGTGNLLLNGNDIDFVRGDLGEIHSVGRISFDWTGGNYDAAHFHGIESKDEAGNFSDKLRINSYADIINTIDANNNSTSRFIIQKESSTDGVNLLTVDESGHTSAAGNVYSQARNFVFGSTVSGQRLYGDNSSRLYYDSNNSNIAEIFIRDKEDKRYGSVYGNSDGVNFGLLDGDGSWSYLAAKDTYTSFRINNSEKMRILANGNVGIGTTVPSAKLHVNGNARVQSLPSGTSSDRIVVADGNGNLKTFSSGNSLIKMEDTTSTQSLLWPMTGDYINTSWQPSLQRPSDTNYNWTMVKAYVRVGVRVNVGGREIDQEFVSIPYVENITVYHDAFSYYDTILKKIKENPHTSLGGFLTNNPLIIMGTHATWIGIRK